LNELTLVAVHGVLLFLTALLIAFTGGLASLFSASVAAMVGWIGEVLLGALCVGMFLHLARYYDALISRIRAERRATDDQAQRTARMRHWPRASSDVDVVLAIAAGVAIVLLTR
jgi:hypothetical protein